MTDVNLRASGAESRAALTALRLPELQALALERGIVGASKLRKGELVDVLDETTATTAQQITQDLEPIESPAEPVAVRKRTSRRVTSADTDIIGATELPPGAPVPDAAPAVADVSAPILGTDALRRDSTDSIDAGAATDAASDATDVERADAAPAVGDQVETADSDGGQPEGGATRSSRNRNRNRGANSDGTRQQNGRQQNGAQQGGQQNGSQQNDFEQRDLDQHGAGTRNGQPQPQRGQDDDGVERSGRNRYRDRKRGRGPIGDDFEPEITEDDILIPVAGIL
ncbi:MAG: Rho termination factor N-terminal domain-containing protein, partial [Salinibacterium sp.]|nr:Rho termination factor N-terminal domain-containing protein [Salinibacterium sp.]